MLFACFLFGLVWFYFLLLLLLFCILPTFKIVKYLAVPFIHILLRYVVGDWSVVSLKFKTYQGSRTLWTRKHRPFINSRIYDLGNEYWPTCMLWEALCSQFHSQFSGNAAPIRLVNMFVFRNSWKVKKAYLGLQVKENVLKMFLCNNNHYIFWLNVVRPITQNIRTCIRVGLFTVVHPNSLWAISPSSAP